MSEAVVICWFRRDLRLNDNHALSEALKSGYPVLPLFIFDENIINELPANDSRVWFIYQQLVTLNQVLLERNSGFLCVKGEPIQVWSELLEQYDVKGIYTNEDYESYGISRDQAIKELSKSKEVPMYVFQDHVIFNPKQILKADGQPYTIYTPYKRKWLEALSDVELQSYDCSYSEQFVKVMKAFPSPRELDIEQGPYEVKPFDLNRMDNYAATRDFPGKDSTSKLGPHLRFGTVSIRSIAKQALKHDVFLSELIWREFFIQILFHFPHVVHSSFRPQYDNIPWRNNLTEFEKWKSGNTGYPIVDAGMRELNQTGFMHNRVRMVVASFLCKHLLIDWRWGEAYFASKLLDYELASNNGNWQWAAGTGCDAAPYFRVFNPTAQTERFDKDLRYIRKWVPELNSLSYPAPMVEHKSARLRAIEIYKKGLSL